MEPLTLTVAFEPVEDGWVQARIVEIPGVITAGPNQDEARALVIDALREYLLAEGEESPESIRDVITREHLTLQVRTSA